MVYKRHFRLFPFLLVFLTVKLTTDPAGGIGPEENDDGPARRMGCQSLCPTNGTHTASMNSAVHAQI